MFAGEATRAKAKMAKRFGERKAALEGNFYT
jgi:hypothetical protein